MKMKKKTRKRMLEALTIAACVSQLAEFGIELSKSLKKGASKKSLLYTNGQVDMQKENRIITPAGV